MTNGVYKIDGHISTDTTVLFFLSFSIKIDDAPHIFQRLMKKSMRIMVVKRNEVGFLVIIQNQNGKMT
jgi:hypothetical protein